jgi:hypothetical protein
MYWYDKNHEGSMRLLNMKTKTVYGRDSNSQPAWRAPFTFNPSTKTITFDFTRKPGGGKVLTAVFKENRMKLRFDIDGNSWLRIKTNPMPIFNCAH